MTPPSHMILHLGNVFFNSSTLLEVTSDLSVKELQARNNEEKPLTTDPDLVALLASDLTDPLNRQVLADYLEENDRSDEAAALRKGGIEEVYIIDEMVITISIDEDDCFEVAGPWQSNREVSEFRDGGDCVTVYVSRPSSPTAFQLFEKAVLRHLAQTHALGEGHDILWEARTAPEPCEVALKRLVKK